MKKFDMIFVFPLLVIFSKNTATFQHLDKSGLFLGSDCFIILRNSILSMKPASKQCINGCGALHRVFVKTSRDGSQVLEGVRLAMVR